MSEELSLRDLYLILKRHWGLIVVLPVIAATLALLYVLFLAKPVYSASTTLSIQTTTIQSKLENRIETSDAPVLNREQIETIALSRPILEAVLKSQPEDSRPRDATGLAETLKVKFVQQASTAVRVAPSATPLVTMEAKAETARQAAEIANVWSKLTLEALNQLPQIRLSDSIVSLEKQTQTARGSLTDAEKQYQAFNVSTTLALDQATLNAAIEERSQLNTKLSDTSASLEQARTELSLRQSELNSAQRAIGLSDSSDAAGFAATGTDLAAVRGDVQAALKDAQAKYTVAAEAKRGFSASDDRSLLQGRISSGEGRLVQINATLQTYQSRLETLQARLAETKRQIAGQPQLVTLEREITADPAIAAAIQQNKQNLGDLVGLKLQNQELNPVYQTLLQSSVQLQTDLKAITAERDAITAEQTRLSQQVSTDRSRQAQLEENGRRVDLDLSSAQQTFQAAQARAARLNGVSLSGRTLDSGTPEYQRLRSLTSDLDATRSKLSANLASLQQHAQELDGRISTLKQRVSDQTLRSSRLTQNLDLARDQLKLLDQKLTDLRIERSSAGNLAQLLVPAFPPTRKVNGAALPIALAAVVGLLLGLIAPFLLEALRDPKASPRPLEENDRNNNGLIPSSAD